MIRNNFRSDFNNGHGGWHAPTFNWMERLKFVRHYDGYAIVCDRYGRRGKAFTSN